MSPQFVRSSLALHHVEKYRGKSADYDSFVDRRLTFFAIITKGRDEVFDRSKPEIENVRCFGLHRQVLWSENQFLHFRRATH